MNRHLSWLKKDGWLLLGMAVCGLLCLFLASGSTSENSAENRISRVLSAISGAGKVDVAVYYDDATPCGAVVVAGGADSIAVRLQLTDAVTRLLGIDASRVAVYDREGGAP